MRRLLEHWRAAYLVAVVAMTLFTGYHCLDLRVDLENRSMESDSEDLARSEREFERLFGTDESVFVAFSRPDLPGEEGKNALSGLVEEFARIEGVDEVSSLLDTDFTILPFQEGLLVSDDRTTTGIVIRLKRVEDEDDKGESLVRIIGAIRSIVDSRADADTRIAMTGLPVQKVESASLVLRDQRIFSPLSFLVLGIVLFAITRSLPGTLVPLLIAGLTICWTLGLYAMTGQPLNMITSLLPPVIMTISVATTIHIFLDWARGEGEGIERILGAMKRLNLPCLFAAITTVIGFLSLVFSHTPAVRSFGLFAALGVTIGYVLGTSFLAVCLSFLHAKERSRTGGVLAGFVEWIAPLPIRHPRKILAVASILAVAGACGIPRVKINTDLLRFLGPGSRLVQDTRFVEERLTGTNAIELLVARSDGTAFAEWEELTKVGAFQERVGSLPRVRHVLSPVDLVEASGMGIPTGSIPPDLPLEAMGLDSHWSKDLKTVRIAVRTDSIGTGDGAELIARIRSLAAETLGGDLTLSEAGDFNRVIVESNQLASSQVVSFGVAIVLILLSIGIVFRSVLYMCLAILPNVTPLLMTAAIMGYAKIDLSAGTAMIASVVIGLAVDDTIHFMAAFRQLFAGDCDAAILATNRSSGFGIISTTVTLSAGFWVAIFGSFQPTVHFALLSGITMWFALAFDLLVVPASLKLVFGRNHSTAP